MKKRIVLNDHRDIPMLVYIWKWKVANTATLYHKFFNQLSPRTAYNRLNRLSRYGFLEIYRDTNGKMPVWTLTNKGFKVIYDYLPDLKEKGFRSENVKHDFWASALHQGPFLLNQPKNAQLISEQQLRRYNSEDLPNWVPSVDLHRPDGYTFLKTNNREITIAFELERSRKSSAKLEEQINFYSNCMSHIDVIWVVNGLGLLKRFYQIINDEERASRIHKFILLKDFLAKGWNSKIFSENKLSPSIINLFYEKACEKRVKTQCTYIHKILLDDSLCI